MKIHVFVVMLLLSFQSILGNTINFIENDLNKAKKIAAQSGKLVYVHFTAKWCAPCQMMQEYIYTNNQVEDLMNQNYISVIVDVDKMEGYNLMQSFKVKVLPTIMIFNSNSILLNRSEESFGAQAILDLLNKYNLPENKVISAPIEEKTIETSEKKITPKKPAESTIVSNTPKGSVNFTKGFTVQCGTYSVKEVMQSNLNMLNERIKNIPIKIDEKKENGKMIYRIYIGSFEKREDAFKFLTTIKSKAIAGYVKNLAAK
jgi:thiol-disulfide isomerase/thioredoxin